LRALDVVVDQETGIDDAVEGHAALRMRRSHKCAKREKRH